MYYGRLEQSFSLEQICYVFILGKEFSLELNDLTIVIKEMKFALKIFGSIMRRPLNVYYKCISRFKLYTLYQYNIFLLIKCL